MGRFGIADLIDLECRYLSDREADAGAIAERDRAFVEELSSLPPRRQLIHRWLRSTGDELPGRRSLATVRHLGMLGWLGAFLLGAGVAAGALVGRPVDLMLALGLLLGLQLLFLLVLLLAPLLGLGAGPLVDVCFAGLLRIGPLRTWVERHLPGGGIDLLRARLALHRQTLRWFLLELTQRAAVAYNTGILLILGLRIAFSDLRFAWSTSLPVAEQAERLHGWAQWLATPFAWAWPPAAPDLRLVLGSLAGNQPPSELRWWPWLLGMVLVYGLLPRLLLAALAAWRCRSQLDHLPGADAETLAVQQRLSDAFHLRRRGDGDERGRLTDAPVSGAAGAYRCMRPLAWLACPITAAEAARQVAARYGAEALPLRQVGEQLAEPADDPGDCAWLLLAEAWQVPSRKCLRHLRELRRVAGDARPLLVCLLGGEAGAWVSPPAARLQLWRRHLGKLADAHLHVEGWQS